MVMKQSALILLLAVCRMIESLPSSRDPLIINFPPSISHIGNSELPFSSFRQSMPATHQQQQQLLVSSEIEKLTTDEDVHIQAISPPPPAPPNPSSLLTTLPPELLQDCIVGRYLCLRDAARFNRVSRYSHALENQVLFDKYSSTLELLVALQQSLIAHSSNNRVFINGEFLSPAACRRIINNLNKPPLDSLSTDELMLAMEILFMEMKRLEDHNDWAKIPRSSSRVYHLREIFITRIHMLAQPILNHNTSSWLVMDNFRNIVDSISVLAVKYHCQEILQLIFTSLDFELQNHHGQYHHTMLDPDTFLGDLSSSSTLPHLFTRLIELIPGPGLFRFKPTDTLFAQLLVSRIPHTSTIFNLLWNIPEARPEFDGRDDEEWEWILSMLTIAVVAGRRDVVAKNLLLEWVEIRGRRVQQGENGFNVVSQQFDEIVAQLDQQQPFINDDGVGAGNLQLHLLKSLAVEFDLEPCEKVVELIMAVERPDLLDILLRFLNEYSSLANPQEPAFRTLRLLQNHYPSYIISAVKSGHIRVLNHVMNHLTTFNALYDVPSYHLVDEDNSDSFIITSYQISASLEEGLRLALQKGHLEIAKYLLSKDVFGNNNNNNIDMDSYSFNWIMATFTSNPFPVIKTSPTTSITVSTQDAENNETEQQRATALYLLASAMTSCNEKLISFAIDAFIVKDISRRGELEMELVNYLVDKGLPVSLFKRLVLKNTENNDTPSSSSSTTISSLFYPNLIPTQETLDMAFREGNIPVIKYLLSLSSSSSTTPPFLSITDPIGRLEAAVQILYNFRNDRFITVSQMETNGGNMALFLLDHLGSQAAGLISQHHQLVQGNIIGGCGDDENSVSRKKAETVIHRTLDKLLSLNAHTELFIHFCSHLESHLDVMLLTLDRTMKAQNDYLTTWLLEKIVSNNSNIALQLKIDFVIPLSWTFDCFKNFSEILPLDVVTSEMIAAARRRVDQAAEMEHDDMEAAEGERHLAQEILDEMIQE